jgi:lysophospholipid acyltransferase (LPLAT)-like uncharacterized protein
MLGLSPFSTISPRRAESGKFDEIESLLSKRSVLKLVLLSFKLRRCARLNHWSKSARPGPQQSLEVQAKPLRLLADRLKLREMNQRMDEFQQSLSHNCESP